MIGKAQSDDIENLKKNSFYAEIGGNAVLYSLNYDRLFKISSKINVSTRLGYGYTKNINGNGLRLNMVPFELSGLFPVYIDEHFLEIGSGITAINSKGFRFNHTETILALALRVGYRFQKPEGGMLFKIGYTPMYDFYVNNPDDNTTYHTWVLFAGIGIGYTFK